MIRARHSFVLVLLLTLVPAAVSAQRDTRYTREASKYIGMAMTKQTDAERATQYQEALKHLREGMEKDAQNAKVWLLSGSVLASLGEMQEADAAFRKALELHPDYAEDVRNERHQAWANAFNAGIAAMDAQQLDEAVRLMEGAQLLFQERPEALMNLGVLYANRNEPEKAEKAFKDAAAAVSSPLYATLTPEEQEQWNRFRDMAKISIGQMHVGAGVTAFQAEKFDDAFAAFATALQANPHARDAMFNQAQALWAQASAEEKKLETAPAEQHAAIKARVLELYGKAEPIVLRTLEIDPTNDALHAILINANRLRREFAATDAEREQYQQAALTRLQARDALPFYLDEIAITPDAEGGATLAGKLYNVKLEPGATVKVRFTLLGLDGSTVAEQEVTATAGAVDALNPFEVKLTPTGEVAGWKYVVLP